MGLFFCQDIAKKMGFSSNFSYFLSVCDNDVYSRISVIVISGSSVASLVNVMITAPSNMWSHSPCSVLWNFLVAKYFFFHFKGFLH